MSNLKRKIIRTSLHKALLALLFVLTLAQTAYSQPADPSRQLTVEVIEIIGNTKTKPEVILRNLTFGIGDPFDAFELDLNQQRLSNTNFFKEVHFWAQPGSAKGKTIVIIEVKERRWPYFQFEGGHSDLDGWFFVPASLRFDNLFGRGSNMGLRFLLGDRKNELSLFYHNPSLFNNSAFIDVQLFGAGQNFVHYFGANKTEQNVDYGGLRIELGGTKGLFRFFQIGFRSATYDPRNFVTAEDNSQITDLPPSIADDINETQIQTFSLGFSADLRDNRTFPLDGFWGSVIAERASDQTNSDVDFSKVTLDARFYKRVSDKNVFAFHFKGGYITEDAPFYERFYLGGANSLRGYDFSRLTPLGGGTKLILTNTEFRFPLTTNNFPYHKTSGVIFFDAGGIWLPGQTPRLDDFATSIGVGVRIRLPVVGVTRFDFTFPLKKIDDNDFKAHISLGLTF